MAVAVSGNLCTCLLRYFVLAFLASSVLFTTASFLFPNLSSEDLRKNAAGLIQRGAGAAGVSAGSLSWIDSQSPTFEVASIKYSQQKMAIRPVSRGGKDFVICRVHSA